MAALNSVNPISHVASYYAATANQHIEYPALQGDIHCDICVVGGGSGGVSTALELAEKGFSVTLLEGGKIAWAASGRNGGQVNGGWNQNSDSMITQYGKEVANLFWSMALEGKKIIHDRINKYHIDCDYVAGYLSVATRPRHLREIEEFADYRARWGYPDEMTILSKNDLANYIGSERYLGGIADAGDGHLHPLNLMMGEAKAATQLGVKIFEQTRVNSIDYGDTVTLHTNNGRVLAKQVALCGNCDLGKTVPSLTSKIMPAGTYIIATEPLGEKQARQLLPTNAAVCDLNYVLDYFRTTKDNRLLFGGLVAYTGKEPHNFPSRLRHSMLKTFPQLKDAKIDFSWGGNIDLSVTRMPHLGRVSNNVFYMQGFSGHGVVPTRIAGRIMAEMLAGQATRFDLWNKLKHYTFPGGQLLRFPALLLGTTWYRLRDLLG